MHGKDYVCIEKEDCEIGQKMKKIALSAKFFSKIY